MSDTWDDLTELWRLISEIKTYVICDPSQEARVRDTVQGMFGIEVVVSEYLPNKEHIYIYESNGNPFDHYPRHPGRTTY